MQPFDTERIRNEFPILARKVRGSDLVYLDNAATTHKPKAVIDSISEYYSTYNSNIHRGVHLLSQEATKEYELARKKISKFINAARVEEIIYTRGTTEAINLIASTYGRANLKEGDEVLISAMEHHSNIVPWQLVCSATGARLKVIPMNDSGELILEEFDKLLSERTRIVSVVHVSNSLGTVNPVKYIVDRAHEFGAVAIVDGAQSIQHIPIDVQALGCDFYAFSGHKIYGPTGIGALYGKFEILSKMPPYQGGGDMIRSVTFEKTTFNDLPYKFEAGTPDISGAIGLGIALDFVRSVGMDSIAEHEKMLLDYATEQLSQIESLRIIGTAAAKASVLSFVLDGIHPHDIGTFLDMDGVAVRTGHHCTEPVMHRFNIPATSRASFAMYNTKAEIDALAASVRKVIKMFA